jgi:hypothetical protein
MPDPINHHPAYRAVDRDDFGAMIEVDRYGTRCDAFDEIISRTVDHFWDPGDPAYVDFSADFPRESETLMPSEFFAEFNSGVTDRLDEGQQIALSNELTRFSLSQILHGEQGALSLSASLCHVLVDPGGQEYASNQAREEARHVNAFSRYIARRFGKPLPVGDAMGGFFHEIVLAPEVYKKLIGMQMVVEGFAMGAFATMQVRTRDPLLRRVIQLVMTDEAFHHRFGRIWADLTVPELSEEEHVRIEDWAADTFEMLRSNLMSPEQKKDIYPRFGLEWQWVRDALAESFTDSVRRKAMGRSTNAFRVLIKTLLHAGIITERTRERYARWVDMQELQAEGPRLAEADRVAEAAMQELREINRDRKKLVAAAKLLANLSGRPVS